MATNTLTAVDSGLVERLRSGFLREYYRDEIGELAENYPSKSHLRIDWSDLFQFDPDVAEDYLVDPDEIDRHLREALADYDLPIPVTLDDVDVRVVGLNESDVYSPIELTKQDDPGYVGVRGELAKVTTPNMEIQEAAFECKRCGTLTYIEQSGQDVQEPHECQGCERQGPFTVNFEESDYDHYCKVRVTTPPDETGDLQSEHIDGDVRGDLVWHGHPDYGLVARSGEAATVYGRVEKRPKDDDGRLYEEHLRVEAIEFENDGGDVDIAAHRETFEELAARDDAVELFAQSLAPELYATPEWERALELLVAYLFGAPRIDIPGGPTFRGDIHVLIIGDFGTGKSMVNEAVASFAPKCIKESVTGMSSDVGLLAAAVEDDFGDGQWTLQPGILVRANGGHVILDEIDKTDVDLERMNDALEGEQVVDVNKAGQSATYKSRVGLLATGNPAQSRFDPHTAISAQLDIDQSLLSRFDGIVTMQDEPDEELDAEIAETQGLSYVEAQEYAFGERDELDRLERDVPVEVGRAWIANARENVYPTISESQVEDIRDWYAEEVRQLNEQFGDTDAEGGDMPVPATARVVAGTIRFAVAFARVRLREDVADEDVERAMSLAKALIGQNFDGEKFQPQFTRPETQDDRIDTIRAIVRDEGQIELDDLISRCVDRGMSESKVEHEIEQLKRAGELMEPQTGEVRLT